MKGLPNRKQRREWARQQGLLKKRPGTYAALIERMSRSMDVGRQLHNSNTERILREEEDRKNNILGNKVVDLMNKGMTQEEALKALNKKNNI